MQAIISLAGKVDPSLAKAIGQVDKQLSKLSKSKAIKSGLSKVGSGIATGAKALATAGAAVAGAGASAAVAIGSAALQQYATYEQMVGGIDTLFKDASGQVQQYAAEAYRTAGVSANSYMEQATSMSASLIQGLGGDTQAAASMVDLAIRDMSDNANKMGTDLGSIQQTYQSLMRGNYAMLDNLKLGYGGTKSELQRLVKDASKLTGEALDPSKFSDVITAIHAVQDNLGITGTTAKEAATTIEGSVNSMKGAWDNWLTGLGREDADMGALTDQLLTSLDAVAKNVGPRIMQIGQSMLQYLPQALSGAAEVLAPVLSEALAGAWNMAAQALGGIGIQLPGIDAGQIGGFIQSVVGPLASAMQTLSPFISQLVNAVLPPLVSFIQQLSPLLSSIATAVLPPLIALLAPLVQGLLQIASAALPPLTAAVQAVAPILMQIAMAILPALQSFMSALAPVVQLLAQVIGTALVSAVSFLAPILSTVAGIIGQVFGIASTLLNSVIIPIISPLMQIISAILPPLMGLLGALQGPLNIVFGGFQLVLGAVQSVCDALAWLIDLVGQAAAALANSPIGQAVGAIGGLFGFATGGFTTGPYIAGEDPRYPNEAVISFNPAYRAQNLRYWQMAGHMLGASPARAASVSGGGGGGSTTYDFSGMTFAPRVEVRGNASKADIIAAIKECELEFVDTIRDMLARDEEDSYAAA